ncbi:MAG: hypothetical protein J7L82_02025 [Staphylothermus sp.]|nr:hypothetical protein [Staphylothermus sp.]
MKNFLKKAAYEYYNGNPILEDSHFDYLADKYNFDDLGAKDGEVKHLYQMYSLRNIYEDENKAETEFSKAVITTPKLDGASLALVYDDGFLISATTRGDGIQGKDCTHLIIAHPSIPNNVPYTHKLQITGEVVVPKTTKNARNVAAGALNLKSEDEFITREITFIAYGMSPSTEETYLKEMKLVQSWKFNTVVNSDYKEFPRDGVVFRVDNNAEFEMMGYTNKHPRGAFALKKRDVEPLAETTLRKVIWQTSKSGRITPVAHFDPVELSDATISKATLNNAGFVEELKLNIGDKILVRRAGKVIPQVVTNLGV